MSSHVAKLMKHVDVKQQQLAAWHVVHKRAGSCTRAVQPLCRAELAVKICGVTNVDDAAVAAAAGATFVGLIAWPRAKRSVSPEVAQGIAKAARAGGAVPVAVFVDEDAEQMRQYCEVAGVEYVQLHGDASRAALGYLPEGLQAVYVAHADPSGRVQTQAPLEGTAGNRLPTWIVIDGPGGGTGQSFDWQGLQVPHGWASQGWLLAGGLHPGNVAAAVKLLRPSGVDVSSGVCGPDGLRKDAAKVQLFVQEARAAAAVSEQQLL